MKTITLLCPPDYEPRSLAVWAKVFPHIPGEEANSVKVKRIERLRGQPAPFGDAYILTAPFKAIGDKVVNFIHRGKPYNTDYEGFIEIRPWMPKDARVVVLGTGCLAKTLLAALRACGHKNLYVWGRDHDKAKALAKAFGVRATEAAIDPTWFEMAFSTVPYSQGFNETVLMDFPTRVVNYVWGPEAERLSQWQAAAAMQLVWPEYSRGQFVEWMNG